LSENASGVGGLRCWRGRRGRGREAIAGEEEKKESKEKKEIMEAHGDIVSCI
jgi:hypothetical protein